MPETRKVAAILVADIVGYSRLAGAEEERTLARLRTLRSDLIDPTIAIHGGRLVKRTGDGAVVEFRSVVEAVRSAIEVQSGLADRNAGVPEGQRIVSRVGIHLGDIVEEADGDLMGDGVNIAARLQAICEPGGICLSAAAYEQVRDKLQVTFVDLGQQKLKNIARPVRAYSLKLGATVGGPPVARKASGKTSVWLGLGVALVAALGAGGWLGWRMLAPPPTPASAVAAAADEKLALAPRLSIVVLPFANLGGDPGQDYLVDALTDELTTSLARLHDSFVIARNTAMIFKGKPIDAKAIGKDLGVRYVLEGSVQPSGDRMRVNAQLIDAGSGAHLWAEQFDTPRADLLQTQDAIVTHLTHAMDFQLFEAEAARLKRAPAANRDAEDLSLQCIAGSWKAGGIGKEADAASALCEQALAIDPNNVRALMGLAWKSFKLASTGVSGDPKGDLERADALASKALALDPNWTALHQLKGFILLVQARYPEAVAEHERALALDPSNVYAAEGLGWDYADRGEFDKGIEYFDKAIRASPHDSSLVYWYGGKAFANFGLKRYDQAIEWARQAIAINPNYTQYVHATLAAALALTGQETQAREALTRYLALPSTGPLKTIAAWKAYFSSQGGYPPRIEANERMYDGLRKAGMPEE
jgi:TolB-like protein/class 3 adenylate cyclase/Flp pilus assembly protein TadD